MLGKDLINKQMEDRIISFVESKALLEFVDGSYSYLSIVYEVFAIEEATTCHKKVAEKIGKNCKKVLTKPPKSCIILKDISRKGKPREQILYNRLRGGIRKWQKSESRKASLLTAHFVALSVQPPVQASSPSFARESTMRSRA